MLGLVLVDFALLMPQKLIIMIYLGEVVRAVGAWFSRDLVGSDSRLLCMFEEVARI